MTVSTTTRVIRHVGNGVATSFPYDFVIPDAASARVELETIATGARTLLATSAYSITGLGDTAGGGVTYPLSGSPMGDDEALVVYREVPYTQDLDITNQDGFHPESVEEQLDKIVYQTQQLADESDRSIKFPIAYSGSGTELPSAASRANKAFWFGPDGEPAMMGSGADIVPPVYRERNALNAATIASEADGYVAWMAGLPYKVNSAAVLSAADDLSVGGLEPWLIVTPEQFGGTTATAIQAMMTWAAGQSQPVLVRFRQGVTYTIAETIDCDLPEGSSIVARGAKFTCTHDGVAFDLNPEATAALPITSVDETYTKRRIYWIGGHFTNTNASKTASVAIQGYFLRGVVLRDVYMEKFYAGVKFGGKDSYLFDNVYTYNNVRHYWVPAEGVLFTAGLSGNDLVHVHWADCQMSAAGDEAGIYFENRVIGLKVKGGHISGATTVASIRLSDNSTIYSRNIEIDTHMEQIGAGKAGVLFDASGGQGFYSVKIGGEFSGTGLGWIGVQTAQVRYAMIDALFLSGVNGTGIKLDSLSRSIQIEDGVGDYAFSKNNFLSVSTPVDLNGLNREHVTLLPQTINVPQIAINDGTTDLTNRAASGDLAATTIDMSALVGVNSIGAGALPPVAYDVAIKHADSGSAAAGAAVFARANTPGGGVYLQADVRGVANGETRSAIGRVPADANGDISVQIEATGAGTATTSARLLAIHR